METIKNQMQAISTGNRPLSSAVVNGRTIYIFELQEPLPFGHWRIPCVELPHPAQPHLYLNDGWEHVEFVIPSDAVDLNGFKSVVQTTFSQLGIGGLPVGQYSETMPRALGEKLTNQTISFTKKIGLTVKFHPHPIKDIIQSVQK